MGLVFRIISTIAFVTIFIACLRFIIFVKGDDFKAMIKATPDARETASTHVGTAVTIALWSMAQSVMLIIAVWMC